MKLSTDWMVASGAGFGASSAPVGYAHLKHYTVEYCESGNGPPLVMVPGLAGGYGLLGPLSQALSERFRIIRYQLRGEDDCFALRQRFGLHDLVSDLAEFMDWLYLEKPILLGVSFGGVLALEFAARYPGRLQGLVVQGTGARFDRGLLQRVASAVLSHYPLPADNPFVNQFFNLLFGGRQNSEGPLFQFVTRQCWRTDQSVMVHRLQMVEKFNGARRLESIRAPSLILAGDHDLLVSERSLQALSAGLSSSQLVRLPGCGHLAFVSHPQRVAEEVNQFLEPILNDDRSSCLV